MADDRPQYYENTLAPLPVNTATIPDYLHELRTAVYNGAQMVHANEPTPEKWGFAGMWKHFPGMTPPSFNPQSLVSSILLYSISLRPGAG